ncbi:hypothetical protein M9H77_31212 [Catharanthus roseus]|uniref:Uncharacterized protein n=1 Tax=Catharanthus roseus TaxID=4058 RepID=A0ACB9ZZE3_CATRO|nr:hypothetical protein M9H77_31212 [Catharanthus roseus]
MVTRELREGYKTIRTGEGKLSSYALSLKYFGLYKISCTNWMPTTNVSVLPRDMAVMLFFIGVGKPFNMGSFLIPQNSSDIIISDLGEKRVTKKPEPDIKKAKEAEARSKPPLKYSSPSNLCMCPPLLLILSIMLTGFSLRSLNSRLSLFKVTCCNFVLNMLPTESLIHNFVIAGSKRGSTKFRGS